MTITIDNATYLESRTNPGEPWRGWPVHRTLAPYQPTPHRRRRALRYRGTYPALKWLAEQDPEAAAVIWQLRAPTLNTHIDREADTLPGTDDRMVMLPREEELIAAASDGRAILPVGRLAKRAGSLAAGFPQADRPHRVDGKWFRHGRAIFSVSASESQQGLLMFWLTEDGKLQLPQEKRVLRGGSKIPTCWSVDQYLNEWQSRQSRKVNRASSCPELESLYESECVGRHIARKGTSLPETIYAPSGHSRVEIPSEKAAAHAWLAAEMEGKPITRLPPGVAVTVWNGRSPGNKQGLSEPEIWSDPEATPELPVDISLTVETVLARGSLKSIADAHGSGGVRPDRAGARLLRAAARYLTAANDNHRKNISA